MGVGEDFATFRDNYQITQEKIGSISYRYKRITRQLNTDFRDNTSDTANSMYVGSYGRDTAAKGLSDLDMAFILPYAEYAKYHAFATNGQSALLQAVKRSIQKTYPTSESFGDGQVVVITFDDGVRFEILRSSTIRIPTAGRTPTRITAAAGKSAIRARKSRRSRSEARKPTRT